MCDRIPEREKERFILAHGFMVFNPRLAVSVTVQKAEAS